MSGAKRVPELRQWSSGRVSIDSNRVSTSNGRGKEVHTLTSRRLRSWCAATRRTSGRHGPSPARGERDVIAGGRWNSPCRRVRGGVLHQAHGGRARLARTAEPEARRGNGNVPEQSRQASLCRAPSSGGACRGELHRPKDDASRTRGSANAPAALGAARTPQSQALRAVSPNRARGGALPARVSLACPGSGQAS
jgi:hypothetical protein